MNFNEIKIKNPWVVVGRTYTTKTNEYRKGNFMKKKTNYTKYNPKTYKVYGYEPLGNHTLQVCMGNDKGLYNYVKSRNKYLASLPKGKAISLIKLNATEKWSREDLKKVNGSNVKADKLKSYLRNFND